MQVPVLIFTIAGASYLLLFRPDSPVAVTFLALAPLSWLGLFTLRFFTERKKKKIEVKNEGPRSLNSFHDPQDFIDKNKSKEN